MTASSAFATALSFTTVRGVWRNRKSMSIVVTGAPWSAAAALPIRIACRPVSWSNLARVSRNGRASIYVFPADLIHLRQHVRPFGNDRDPGGWGQVREKRLQRLLGILECRSPEPAKALFRQT